jgi:hypothetical protein
MTRVAIIGSHGLYANYGGWDQLVNNLALKKAEKIEYIIFNSFETNSLITPPPGVKVKRLGLKASGFQGLFYDFWSIILCYWSVDTILLLGVQGIPLISVLRVFKKVRIVSNVGGIEWERPKFNLFSKLYLKFCFNLSFRYSKFVILDNPYYNKFVPARTKTEVKVIPYGGEIDSSLKVNHIIENKYPFIRSDYFLSISRSLKDNLISELCNSFVGSVNTLVLISNFSRSAYGLEVYDKYRDIKNIVLIDGLYIKPELDLIRRNCKAYIHTHTLCGTAPSLVEMIIAQKPVLSIDIPQNRYTLHEQGFFFSDFKEIQDIDKSTDFTEFIPSSELCQLYAWKKIVSDYETLFTN